MSADLEEQLKELGPECRAVVARLRAARTVAPRGREEGQRSEVRGRTAEWLVAASLLVALGLSIHLLISSPRHSVTPSPSFGAREYHLSPAEMIASQQADGSWQNDFLTRRNAEVLARCDTPEARIAYKKAVRNLRSKGVL